MAASQPVYQLTTVAGSDQVGDGGQAIAAQVQQPEGMVVDPAGNLYIADAANNRVRKVNPAGVVSTVAGNGHQGFSGDNGPAADAQLNQPYGLALDAAGNLYIADYGNQRVRAIGTNGNINTVAGSGQGGTYADGGPAVAALLLGPHDLATDAAGNLYISELLGHRVRRVTPGGIISTVAGIGIAGFSGDGGPAVAAQLNQPAGLALDGAGNLYIVDSLNVRIREVLASTGAINTVCSQQTFNAQNFVYSVDLFGLAANAAGDLYFLDTRNSAAWQLNPAGVLTLVAGVPGGGGYVGDGQPALQTSLIDPVDVALDTAGDLYISELQRVRCVTAATGIVNTVAGNGTFGFGGDGGSALMAVLNTPTGVAINNGALYIADTNNQRVRQVASGSISTVAGNGTQGYSGDGQPAAGASLSNPTGLAFDPSGNLYIADTANDSVRSVSPAGMIATFAGSGTSCGFGAAGNPATLTPLCAPQGVVADLAGNTYIADTKHNLVSMVDSAGNIQIVAGNGTAGDAGAGNTAWGELYQPQGVALDSAGNLYIADTQNHRIRVLAPGGAISTVAGTGTAGFGGDGGAATAAQLNAPSEVAVDAVGNIYIADTLNHRVRLVTTDGNIATIAGTGDAAYNGDDGPAVQIALSSPYGVTLDGQGNVYVADTGNNRVRMLSTSQAVVVTPPPGQLINVAIANAASLQAGPLAPGEIFSIFGQGMGPAVAVTGTFDSTGTLSTTLSDVQVLFVGEPVSATPAPLYYVQANQINAQVPYAMAGQPFAQLLVVYQGVTLASMQVPIANADPALFTVGSGTGNAVVVNQDGSLNSDAHPAPQGSTVVLYATGEGQTSPAGVTGQPAQAPFPLPVLPVSLTMGGIPAGVVFAGEAPGFVGVMQINATVPSGFVPPGDLALVLTVGTYQSPSGVTIAVE
ncbi:MAG: hypothetical protein ABSG65_19680 [Bryobacteraceae bacterium]